MSTNKLETFTNRYSLTKTLRFELKPVGSDGKRLDENQSKEVFQKIIEKDRKVKAAYTALKPVMDKIHEDIINTSLTSDEVKQIDFSSYFEEYKKGKNKNVDKLETALRDSIGEAFEKTTNDFAEKAGNDEKGKPIFKKKKEKDVGVKYLTQAGIIKYIENNIKMLVPEGKIKEFIDLKETVKKVTDKKGKVKEKKKIENIGHLGVVLAGNFEGYNQSRENYYVTKEEKATAVATRIVHENLPKFCDNVILFGNKQDDYIGVYQFLKDNNIDRQIKDAETNTMIEAYEINEEWFKIEKFYECLTQNGIDAYNRVIGHYNLLINKYNHAKRKGEKDFKKLPPFKTLFKQIGSAKRILFEQIETDEELKAQLETLSNAGEKYFKESDDINQITIQSFTKWMRENEDWDGVYWSKAAVDKISNKYLSNWHEIKDRIQKVLDSKDKEQKDLKDSLKSVATYKKNREEELKINDAVELSGLFEILNQQNGEDWSKAFFKQSVLEERQSLIDESKTPSQNLINLICTDIEELAKTFCTNSIEILGKEKSTEEEVKKTIKILEIDDYKNEDYILAIKEWLDIAKSVLWLIKYFEVKESKVKGNSINSELTNILTTLLRSKDADWYDWYDLIRNYLSKKPQDDAKKNKLKLNFEYGNLLNGFVDSHSDSDNATQYGGYLFRKKVGGNENSEYEYFLGISKNAKLFRCHLQDKIQDNDKCEFERLEYYQAKSTTYFDNKYSENKANLVSSMEVLVDDIVRSNESLKDEADKIKKKNKDGEITPTTLFDRIKKQANFNSILNNKSLVTLVNQTIQDLKTNALNFVVRAPKLQEIQSKEYNGVDGLKQIIEDLQTIAKENKVFNFFKVSKTEFDTSFVDENKPLYLFKISNKDLSYAETSQKDENGKQKRTLKGTENLHTQFFRALMREFEGCENIDLGKGEIFFREPAESIKKEPTHKVGDKMLNRREKVTGNTIPYKVHNELYLYANKKIASDKLSAETKVYLDQKNNIDENRITVKCVKHDITKDKRFTEVKYQLHLSIALNFNAGKNDVTEIVNNEFTKADDIQFLGIDRGEKHLIYYSLVNKNGEILSQGHFDTINKKDYLQEINEAAKKRREKQENWQQKGNISNLKDGYISLVIHEIIEKMKDKDGNYKPTFIVLEDLNTGFKRSRQKFEQQVYQKFEVALAKKLNYLVDKKASIGTVGSVSNALQLTPPISGYDTDIKNKKQIGIMLYTRANYTSVTDPATGWRKTIYLKTGSEKDIREQILDAFTEIKFEDNDYYFQYTDANGKEWKLWSGKDGKSLERYRFKRGNSNNEPTIEPHYVKDLLDKLFEKFDKTKSLLDQLKEPNLKELTKVNEHTAWETLRFVIDIIQQIRNSGDTKKGQDDNFLLSPVRNEQGEHFDSRIYEKQENPKLPKDADANGAYNIARKGIIMYEHIKKLGNDWNRKVKIDGNETSDLDLFVSDNEWDLWLNNKKQWNEKLNYFASKSEKEEDKTKKSDT